MAGEIVASFNVREFPDGYEVEAERSADLPEHVLVDVMRQYLNDIEGPEAPGWGRP